MNIQRMIRIALALLGFSAAADAVAIEMYYRGDLPGGITNAQNYCSKSNLDPTTRYDRLPGPNDEITIVRDGMSIDIDDGHFAFLRTIKGITLKNTGTNFRCNVCIQNDQELTCWIADYSGYGSGGSAFLVKTGAGDLHLCTNTTAKVTRMGYDVQEGDLWLNPPDVTATTAQDITAKNIRIAAGCTVHVPPKTTITMTSIAGAGTLTNDMMDSTDAKNLTVDDVGTLTEPTVFSGQIRGCWYIVNLQGYTYFAGTSDYTTGNMRAYSASSERPSDVRAVGFLSYPESGASSLGISDSIDNRTGLLRLRYLGAEPTTAGRPITVNDTTCGPTTIDGGAWGGLTWAAAFNLVRTGGQVGKQQRIAFSGTNAGERCVFSGYLTERTVGGTNYSFHVTKDGPGVWRFLESSAAGNTWSGALTVRDGTLEFDTIAETNRMCALGLANACYPDVCDYTTALTPVDWAWRLGDAANASVTGSLQYVGTSDFQLESRKTALAGVGRLRFGKGSLFKYVAGICGLGSGEKSISFESAAGATNVIANVSDGEGKVSVVKEGVGTTVLTGNLGFSGDLRAEAGEFVLKDINNADYRYYCINFKENVSTSLHPGLADYRMQHPKMLNKPSIKVTAFGLYDANGKQLFSDAGDTNVNYLALAPGHGQFSDFEDIQVLYNAKYSILCGIQRLFGGNCAAGAVFCPQWKDNTLPTLANPDSWYRVHLHLADDKATPVSWDMCYCQQATSDNFTYNVTALSIDASADGTCWQEVAATNGIVHLNTADHSWLSNPDDTAWDSGNANFPERQSHPNKFPLTATKQQGSYARPTPRSVFVRKGATLRNESATKISVSGLALDKSGMGTLEGFSLSASGTLSVEGLADERTVTIPADFSTVSGYENLADWTLVVNGVPSKKYTIAGVTENGITLTKHGLILIFR